MTRPKRITFTDRRVLYVWSGAVVGALVSRLSEGVLGSVTQPLTLYELLKAMLTFVLLSFAVTGLWLAMLEASSFVYVYVIHPILKRIAVLFRLTPRTI